MFSRLAKANVFLPLARNRSNLFSCRAAFLSSGDDDFYQSKINEAKALYNNADVEGAKSLLRSLWEKFPRKSEAYQLHHSMIVHHTQFPFYGKEYVDLIKQREKYFPEETQRAKHRLADELKKLNQPITEPARPSIKK